MSLRTIRERWLQIFAYEIVGFAVAAPLYGVFFGGGASEGAIVIIALFVPELIWCVLHNMAFDKLEWTYFGRVASARPHRWRIVHALSHEITATIVSLPVIMLVTDHGIMGALLVDIWLGVFYACYAYLFHLVYDRLRPIAEPVMLTILRDDAASLPDSDPASQLTAAASQEQAYKGLAMPLSFDPDKDV